MSNNAQLTKAEMANLIGEVQKPMHHKNAKGHTDGCTGGISSCTSGNCCSCQGGC